MQYVIQNSWPPKWRCGHPTGHPKLLQLETPLSPILLGPLVACCPCKHSTVWLHEKFTCAENAFHWFWGSWNTKDFLKQFTQIREFLLYLTRSQRVPWLLHRASYRPIVIIIVINCVCRMHILENFQQLKVRGRGLVSWSSMTRTFLRDNNTGALPLSMGPIALRDIWRYVFSRPYLVRSRLWYNVASVCLSSSVRNVLWLNGAS